MSCLRFLGMLLCCCGCWSGTIGRAAEPAPIRVLVWDEQQPAQKQAYENFIGHAIADHLATQPGLAVRTACQDDPQFGIGDDTLDNCDVLIWWGHVRQREIKPERGQAIASRIARGQVGLIALHSAHWSTPFVEAMNARAKADALVSLPADERATAEFELTAGALGAVPAYDAPLTPSVQYRKPRGGPVTIRLRLPHCVFPAYRADGAPSTMRTLLADHPIAKDLPREFVNEQDEMYDEPFHVPAPDEVVFEERWAGGEWFRSGAVWRLGAGKVFYFRPGHETYPVYKAPQMLKVLDNAVRYLAQPPAAAK